MNYIKKLEGLIEEGKYIRNDIGMGRVQHVKPIMMNERLMIIMVSPELEGPIAARIEEIIVLNDEIIVFYDGEFENALSQDEYEDYKENISSDEWNIIFNTDAGEKLEDADLTSRNEGFYAEMHDTIEDYINEDYINEDYDKTQSEAISRHFDL